MADRRAADDQLRAVLAAAGASGSWDWDIAADRLHVDARFAELYGLDDADLEAGVATSNFFAAIHPEDRARMRIAVAGMLAGAELFSKEFRVIDRSGAVLWMHGRGQSHRDAADEPVRFTGLLVDVTERKRTEERLRIAQSAGRVGTFEYSDGFATASVSHEFCRLLGLHPTDRLPVRTINAVLATPGDQLIPDAGDAVPETLDASFLIRRGDDGAERWIARRGEVIRDDAGSGYRLLGVVYDTTDAKRLEAELRGLNETLEQRIAEALAEKKAYADVIESSPASVTALALDYTVLAINRANVEAFERAFGRRPEVGGNFLALFDEVPQHREQQAAIWSRALAGETFFVIQEFGDDGLERRWYEVRFSPLYDRDGVQIGASSTSYDVTDRVKAEAQLQSAQEQLRQSQKMEAVGQLTGGIAHDFNNLLTIIIGSIDTAQRRLEAGADPRLRRSLDNAAKGAERAAALTHRLLAFSRLQPLSPRAVDVPRLLAGMSDLLTRTISESIAVAIDAPEELWQIEADPNQLENAILNLAVNARDAMPNGGQLTIRARSRSIGDDDEGSVSVAAGDYVAISVVDTGIGMSAETLAKVFDPFFTTKEVGKGTGLGLSMVYGFVRQSGGDVLIESELDRGTNVTLLLARAKHGAADEGAGELDTVEQGTVNETVLVVEDDDDVRAYTVGALRELGYRVIEAHDGESALRLLDRRDQPIMLLMTDVVMPRMSGSDLAEAARRREPGLKVLYMSGYTRDAIMHDGRLDAGVELIAKPFTFKTLAGKVREVLDRG